MDRAFDPLAASSLAPPQMVLVMEHQAVASGGYPTCMCGDTSLTKRGRDQTIAERPCKKNHVEQRERSARAYVSYCIVNQQGVKAREGLTAKQQKGKP